MEDTKHHHILFGGEIGWSAADWVASDDSVRGGKSQSHLDIDGDQAIFRGHLDIKTLGGAGFASQRTTGDDRHWDLSRYAGLRVTINASQSDGKRYTLILKDEVLAKDPASGREQATTSWEHDFEIPSRHVRDTPSAHQTIFIPWDALTPTYRGKHKDPGRALKLHDIRRMSLMMRSHFGAQHGDFKLSVKAIAATRTDPQTHRWSRDSTTSSTAGNDVVVEEKASCSPATHPPSSTIMSKLLGCLGRL